MGCVSGIGLTLKQVTNMWLGPLNCCSCSPPTTPSSVVMIPFYCTCAYYTFPLIERHLGIDARGWHILPPTVSQWRVW